MGISLVALNINTKPAGSTTTFLPIGCAPGQNATETARQTKQYIAGQFKNLGVAVDNGGTGRTTKTRVAAGNGNLAPTITDSVAGAYYDTTNTDTVSVNDLWDIQTVVGSLSTTTYWWYVMEFIANSGHAALYSSNGTNTRGGIRYVAVGGSNPVSSFTTEAQAQFSVRTAGTWKNISVNVITNTLNAATTIKSRVGGADGGTSFTVASGSGAGIFDDGGSGSDTLAGGNLINISIDTTASASGTWNAGVVSSTIAATSGSASDMWVGGSAQSRTASASVHYNPPIGQNSAWTTTTESLQQQVQPNFPFKVSNFRVKAFTNTYSASCTVTLRKNGADVISLSIPAGSTTEVEDASTVISFTATDNFDISVTGGSSGAAVFQYFGYVLNTFNPGWATGATRIIDGGIG